MWFWSHSVKLTTIRKKQPMAASSALIWRPPPCRITSSTAPRLAIAAVLPLAILMTSGAYRGSEGITNYRRKKNTGHMRWYVSVWVKEDKMCPILDCFPTLSESHSLNPVNYYMRYLRYRLHNQPFALHISKKICGVFFLHNPFLFVFLLSPTLPLLSVCSLSLKD